MQSNRRDSGSVMVWALIFVIVTAGMIISHSAYMASHRQTMDVQLKRKPLAANLARAALTDGLSWFQAQATQPVANFVPLKDTVAVPPVLDTEDPILGLVREFEIRGDLWGRYEIRRNEAMDASLQSGIATPGSVWELAARGYVYRVIDARVPFDQAPNKIVSMARVETSIRTVPLNLPASAAVGADDLLQVTLGPGGKITGGPGVAGIATPPADPIPAVPAMITGTPNFTLVPIYKSEPVDVFKMSLPSLRDVSDMAVVSGSKTWLGARQLAENSIIFHDGDLTLTSSDRLAGSLLLVVAGNLSVQPGTNSAVKGVIFVQGNADIRGPFLLRGMLIGKGAIHLQGNGAGQDAVVQHDEVAVQNLLQSMSRYRAHRVVRNVDDGIRDGRVSTPPIVGTGGSMGRGVVIGDNVVIGDGVVIGDFCGIDDDVVIGNGTTIQLGTKIGKQAQIGVNVSIGTETSIGALAIVADNAVIGDFVTIGVGAKIVAGAIVPDRTIIRTGETY